MAVKKDNIKAETHQYIHTSALRGMKKTDTGTQ